MKNLDELRPIEMHLRPPAVLTPRATQETKNYILERYNRHDWQSLKSLCEIVTSGFVKDLPSPIFSDSTTSAFYYAAIAYKKTGESLKYKACLKILYSLNQFYATLNEIDQELIQKAVREYTAFAEEDGPEVLNDIDIREVLKKSSGCFIATAVYGTPYADEVILLKKFRDNWLLKNSFGRMFVNIYYWISPSIANYIENKVILKKLIKLIFIHPFVKLSNHLTRKEN